MNAPNDISGRSETVDAGSRDDRTPEELEEMYRRRFEQTLRQVERLERIFKKQA